jgi:hypothetical protein
MFVYHVPVLVGYSSGATVVYAALVQSPPGTFAGALSLGFCPDQDFSGAALCPGAGLHYTQGNNRSAAEGIPRSAGGATREKTDLITWRPGTNSACCSLGILSARTCCRSW